MKAQEKIALFWLVVWAGYNTGIERVFGRGFPHNALDFIHGIRAFIPLVGAGVVITLLAFRKKPLPQYVLLTPLGLMFIYALVGIVTSLFSAVPIFALYWALMYGGVIVILVPFLNKPGLLKRIITINWVVAAVIATLLLLFFLMQPGIISSLNMHTLFFNQRPYEGIGTVGAETPTFGMAGARPTGFGRYAALVALVAFWRFLKAKNKKIWWFLAFIFFFAILIFSRGRTEMIAFIPSILFLFWCAKKFKPLLILLLMGVILLTGVVTYNNIHSAAHYSDEYDSGGVEVIYTLSGRTNGVWSDAFSLFLSSPLVGYGFQADRYFLRGQNAHNTIVHTLVQTGIVGTVFVIAAFVLLGILIYRLFKMNTLEPPQKIFFIEIVGIVIFLAVRGITQSLAFFSADWLFLAPIIAYIQALYLYRKQS